MRARYCRTGLDLGPVGWTVLVLFLAVMALGVLYYAALIGLVVAGLLAARWLGRFLSRTRNER